MHKEARASPMFLSPRWMWALAKYLSNVFRPSFWKEVAMNPEKQAIWQVSSAATLAQVAGATAAIHWLELNAPWVLKFAAAVGAVIKAVVTAMVGFAIAVWNVAFNT